MYRKTYHIHFVGIGGIGMSGIAELLVNLGYRVSGSDLKSSDITRHLQSLGCIVYEGHDAGQIDGADVLVASSAVTYENPEVACARKQSVPVVPRAEMLAELMRLKYSVAVAGAHGKTTTTSMVAEVLSAGGLDPTVVVGGKLRQIDSNARLGRGEFIVAEADESDGTFLKMSPTIAVVTNIDREHLDFYPNLDAIQRAFYQFIERIPFYGLAVLCLDNPAVRQMIPNIERRFVTYGMSAQADLQAREISHSGLKSRYTVYANGRRLGGVELNLPGLHNVLNSLAAVAVGLELSIPFETAARALSEIEGVRRRLEIKGEKDGVLVVDDYGHHPTEIRATLAAVRQCWPERRIVVLFQPHRFTRTQALFDDFTRAFYDSDLLIGLPIYSAGESPVAGVDGGRLIAAVRAHGHRHAEYTTGIEPAVSRLQALARPGDVLLTLGAGDVWRVGEAYMEDLG